MVPFDGPARAQIPAGAHRCTSATRHAQGERRDHRSHDSSSDRSTSCDSHARVPDLRRLRYFLAVASELNFSRAATRLHIAQPALSRQVKLLEDELGVELLRRTTHAVELTEAGAFLLARGPALIGAADELWRGVSSFGSGARGSVVLGYGTSAGYETAPRVLQALAERAPDLALSARVLSLEAILAGLEDGEIDVGIVRCAPTTETLDQRLLRREPLGVILRRERAPDGATTIELRDLADEQVLLHRREAHPPHYAAILALYARAGLEPRVMHRELSADLAYLPLVDGRAIAIAGESVRASLPPALVWLELRPQAQIETTLVTRRQRPAVVSS